ncbi:MAG: helix-turn-helix domain-containing protein, partial [Theionarchaea archaeon]|nr:helix-turn-helix domain-containing protein [Theionarchaea archaeon]
FNHIRLPVDRRDCERFKESEERVKRSFWKKWQWKIYVDGKLIQHEQPKQGSDEICKQPGEHNDSTCATVNITSNTNTKEKGLSTQALILQTLANNTSRLKDIAHFSGSHPSTAHYHLRNLTREGKVTKVSRGKYSLSASHSFEDGSHFFDKDLTDSSHFFDTFLRDLSLYIHKSNDLKGWTEFAAVEDRHKLIHETIGEIGFVFYVD